MPSITTGAKMAGERQKELFGELAERSERKSAVGYINQAPFVSLTWTHIIFGAIGILLILSLAFSAGVERGRRLTIKEYKLVRPAIKTTVTKQPIKKEIR